MYGDVSLATRKRTSGSRALVRNWKETESGYLEICPVPSW